jgi:hypothetical protein
MAEKFTVAEIAKVLNEAFEDDSWGLIDPSLFGYIARGKRLHDPDAIAMRGILERLAERINERMTS